MIEQSKPKSLNQRYLSLPLLVRLAVSAFVICSILVLSQDIQIFPGAVMSYQRNPLPEDVTVHYVSTSDGEKLESWRLPGTENSPVAIIFHGNAGDVQNFFAYQTLFKHYGLTSYGFDYRGYGKSTGWPSENGLYKDADAILDYVKTKEGVTDKDIILFGISIGTGPASYLARKTNPGALVLLSPFWSLPEAIKSTAFGFLSPFAFHEFPVGENVSALTDTCLILAHGKLDKVIPYEQGKRVFDTYKGTALSIMISPHEAGHNDILRYSHPALMQLMFKCFGLTAPEEEKA